MGPRRDATTSSLRRAPSELLLALSLLSFSGCASSTAERAPASGATPAAEAELARRAAPQQQLPSGTPQGAQAAAGAPLPTPGALRPTPIRTQPGEAPKPPWKTPPRSVVASDQATRTAVAEVRARNEAQARAVEQAAAERRVAEAQRDRSLRAERSADLGQALGEEEQSRAELLASVEKARRKQTEAGVQAFVDEAWRRAGPTTLARRADAAQGLVTGTRQRVRALRELLAEARRSAEVSRRFAATTLEQGMYLTEAHQEARVAERRRTTLLLMLREAEIELEWASEAEARVRQGATPRGAPEPLNDRG